MDSVIVRTVKKSRRVTAAAVAEEIRNSYAMTVPAPTVRGRLHDAGLKGRVARKKPFLTVKHRAARLKYATQCQEFTGETWKCVVFSDESSFSLTGSPGRAFV